MATSSKGLSVPRDMPVAEVAELVRTQGYVVIKDALTPEQLQGIGDAYDRLLAENPPGPQAIRVELPRLFERDQVFEQLMDNPPALAVVRELLGPMVELGTAGELDYKFGSTPAYIAWHGDFQFLNWIPGPRHVYWIRCVYMIGDVDEDMGPFTLVPRTHTRDPQDLRNHINKDGQPVPIEGQLPIVGKAGSCLINNTEIWHTNTANVSGRPRRLIMVLYKPAWMKAWDKGYEFSPEFRERQTDPVRRQLVGALSWTEHDLNNFPVAGWTP